MLLHKPLIHDVTDTAFWVATYRAIESEREDALFRDPLARRLAGEKGFRIASKILSSKLIGWTVVIRTCMINHYIQEAIQQGVDTVLNLGAGLDTRPYWLDLPSSLRWIEVDYPKTIQEKNRQLQNEKPRCQLERVQLDLSDHGARRQLLKEVNSKAEKILVLTEGVIPYLSEEETASLAHDLREQPQVRYWIVEYFSPEVIKYFTLAKPFNFQLRRAPFLFQPKNWFSFFESRGWVPKDLRYFVKEGERLKRPWVPSGWFRLVWNWVSPKRREQLDQMVGYALLESNGVETQFGTDAFQGTLGLD